MAVLMDKNCSGCSNDRSCCCVSCFENTDGNIFQALKKDELELLISEKQQIKFKAGETIIKQNTTSTHVVCIKEGYAKVYVEGVKDKTLILQLITNLNIVTGGSMFNGNIRNYTISALTDVTCCLIDSSKLVELFSKNNEFAIQILKHHTKQNSILLNKLVNLTQKYMPGRVADTLLYLKNNVFKTNPFHLPITRQDLADLSNMTKESFVRILQEFKASGFVKTHGHSIEIIDEDALVSISKNG